MMKDKNIDEVFRDKLLNYEQEPPAYILENIHANTASVRRNRKIVFWRMAGVAAAILLAFVAGWQINFDSGKVTKPQTIVNLNSTLETDDLKQIASPDITNKTSIASLGVATKRLDTHLTETTQHVSPGTSSESVRNETSEIISTPKSIKYSSTNESGLITEKKEFTSLMPIKKLYRLIFQETVSTGNLQEIESNHSPDNLAEKSIDQQIMEQNKQLLLTQIDGQEKRRWLVGAQVSPAYSVSRGSHEKQYASNMLNSDPNNPVDLGGGLSVEYKSGKRWSLQSGVYYSGMSQASGNSNYSSGRGNDYAFAVDKGSEYLNTSVSVDASNNKIMMNSTAGVIELSGTNSGIVLGTNIEDKTLVSAVVVSDVRFVQNFEYIEIPLYLRYTILDSRFDVEMLGGFSSNLLVGNQTFMESNSGKSLVGKTKDMETVNYSGTLGLGFKYGLSNRIFLNVEPRIKYFLNSLSNNSSVNYKPYTIGVYTGISYQF